MPLGETNVFVVVPIAPFWDRALKRQFGAALASLLVVASPLSLRLQDTTTSTGVVEGPFVEVHRPSASALTEEQALVVDVWREVNRQFVDGTFNNLGSEGWKKKKLDAVKSIAASEGDKTACYAAIRTMLQSLGDPYTRFLTPEQYDALASVAKGGTAGIGVQLQVDPNSGGVVVLSTVTNGPAASGGVLGGDEVLEVDGDAMGGATAELVAARMRGTAGTKVDLLVRHHPTNQPAAAAAAGKSGKSGSQGGAGGERLTLTRATVKVTPITVSRVVVEAADSAVASG
eukprot:CAMPEP_0171910696 /NCGR_PEP_ID=MMETSP0993-20121228/9620_1 /TAXON_ID=483369 /ORGANISM="non described non described, Strain CCMP2098" /LENGTH=286 /DNA_ID=CAMNT_0012543929 /DNA_START=181 /DNA_END=1038 /DNA_ORIENTATION=-